ncbi:MAG: hypothetical protein JXR96_28240, partial [Deltaproteobacteria bacterium]|nr:hypothetical protein [Deltaproteobacteria bacterium]
PCTEDACNPVTGACVFSPVTCNDGDPCTEDACNPATGACVFSPVTCNDGDLCTEDACNPATGACVFSPVTCNDDDLCTTDSCDPSSGCVFTLTVICDDGDLCTFDSCDPDTGQCVFRDRVCFDGDLCTTDGCDPATGACVYTPKDCSDGDLCTEDLCNPTDGLCENPALDCSDNDLCTTDGCDPSSGCTHTPRICDDGDLCTDDSCDPSDGQCDFVAKDCSDDNPCTDDVCDEGSGDCLHPFNSDPCDDNDPCTDPDVCQDGYCMSGPDVCGGENVVILVYLAADNDLDSFGMDDWDEMEAARVDDADWLRVFVFIDRYSSSSWSDTRLYEVHNNSSTELDAPHLGLQTGSHEERNTGDPNTLRNFILDVKDIAGSASYYLIIWNHGDGWRSAPPEDRPVKTVAVDMSSGDDWLTTSELQSAVAGQGLQLIGFDACLEGMVEVAYELRNDALVMVASEEMEPGEGWAYTSLLSQFKNAASPSPELFGQLAVDTFINSASYNDVTLASCDLTAMDALAAAADDMATALRGLGSSTWNALCNDSGLEWFGIYLWLDPKITDLHRLAERAAVRDPGNAAVYQAAMDAVDDAVLYERHRSDHANAHGLSIYFPCDETVDGAYNAGNLEWAADTGWDEMLRSQ